MRFFTCSSNLQVILPFPDGQLIPSHYLTSDNVKMVWQKMGFTAVGRFPSIAVSQAQCYVHEMPSASWASPPLFSGGRSVISPLRGSGLKRDAARPVQTNPQTLQKPDLPHGGLSKPILRRRSPRTGHASSWQQPTCRVRKASGPRQKPDKDRAGQQERVRAGPLRPARLRQTSGPGPQLPARQWDIHKSDKHIPH